MATSITPSSWGELWEEQQQRNQQLQQNYTNLATQVRNLQGEQTVIHRRLDAMANDLGTLHTAVKENTELTQASVDILTDLRDAKTTFKVGSKVVRFIGAAVIGAAGMVAAAKTFFPNIKWP